MNFGSNNVYVYAVSEYLDCRLLESQASCTMRTPILVCFQCKPEFYEGRDICHCRLPESQASECVMRTMRAAGSQRRSSGRVATAVSTVGARSKGFDRSPSAHKPLIFSKAVMNKNIHRTTFGPILYTGIIPNPTTHNSPRQRHFPTPRWNCLLIKVGSYRLRMGHCQVRDRMRGIQSVRVTSDNPGGTGAFVFCP